MAATTTITHLSLIFLCLTQLLLLSLQSKAQTAPAPAPPAPVNLTGILDKNGQYTNFIRLLVLTQVASQVANQLNSSTEGLTVFAPTDNAFNSLPSGALNNLTTQQQVQLVLYHIIPKFYTLNNLLLVSNPVRTQATGQDNGSFVLNFTGQNNQVNVSTGVVQTQINNPLRQDPPLAVYQLDKVLLPPELFGAKSPAAAPAPPGKTPSGGSNTTVTPAAPSPTNGSGRSGRNGGVMGLVVGLGLACMVAMS